MALNDKFATKQDIQRATNLGARAYRSGSIYSPPRWISVKPQLDDAWRRGYVRAKHLAHDSAPHRAAI